MTAIQTQKMESIGSLAGGIAHDFNNILFPIVGLSEMMLNDFPPGSLEQQNLTEIFQAGKRGRELIQQILSFSRQSEHQPIPVHIQKILKEVLKLCRATIPADITIKQDIQTDCNSVMADPTHIHQIAMNLITNAYHAVEPAGGTISIQLSEMEADTADDPAGDLAPGRYAMLSVSDTGTGIAPNIINKIFDPYFTTKEKGRGTGLGLATVYGIVKAHGGNIRVTSDIGKGAAFNVYLPLLEKTQDSEPVNEKTPLPTGTGHILLVDDEKSIVHLEKQMLKRLGYQASGYTSSRDALAAFKTEPSLFDLVITDMNMPNMNGMQLAAEMIAIRSDIPIILCTGFSERINSKKAEALGIGGLLMKPLGMKDLKSPYPPPKKGKTF
jgi:CheY-like chemotaxis protein